MTARLRPLRRRFHTGRHAWLAAFLAGGLSLSAGCTWIDQWQGKPDHDEETAAMRQARVDCGDTSVRGFGHDEETEALHQARVDSGDTSLRGFGNDQESEIFRAAQEDPATKL